MLIAFFREGLILPDRGCALTASASRGQTARQECINMVSLPIDHPKESEPG
ncbi:hypothetical protein Pth03_64060 [Planotetraspora thailandica]|uniref:Uncharacterized protein n=1 Tax=Planotetraspora thailandica TaxID=487172 RepID=A0A8J3XZH0_9ACTN|nr:hypothetical protein Pth03_64060 [Planotetraspora thailandica]